MLGQSAIGGAAIGATSQTAGAPAPPVGVPLRVSQVRQMAVSLAPAASAAVSEARVLAVYRLPAQFLQASGARGIVTVKRASDIQVSESRVLAVVQGRVANPRIRAWTFTLDGHDFYVLRLGDGETLVYDFATEKWIDWDTTKNGAWRANIGTRWTGGAKYGAKFGSSVVAGDDTFGVLWFLDPMQQWDDAVDGSGGQVPFLRVVTGQMLAKGRQALPCYALFVDGDNYGITATDFVPSVKLETSDDQGRTFDNQGALTVAPATPIDNYYEWLSLGQITSPGRIFRVTHNGIFSRIDTMGMNDDAG